MIPLSISAPWCLSVTEMIDMVNITPELDFEHWKIVSHGSMGERGKVCVTQ